MDADEKSDAGLDCAFDRANCQWLMNCLTNEYELLQGKIDKIGDFKFKILGWLISLYAGISAAIIAYKPGFWLPFVSFLLPTVVFVLKECEQVHYQQIFVQRLRIIEEALLLFHVHELNLESLSLSLSLCEGSPKVTAIMRENPLFLRNDSFCIRLHKIWGRLKKIRLSYIIMLFYALALSFISFIFNVKYFW